MFAHRAESTGIQRGYGKADRCLRTACKPRRSGRPWAGRLRVFVQNIHLSTSTGQSIVLDMGGKARTRPGGGKPVEWEPYLEHLRTLPFVRNLRARLNTLSFATPERTEHFHVSSMRGALGYARVNSLIAQRAGDEQWILFAPYVSPGIAEQIAQHGGNYVDANGNCHITLGEHYLVHVEGKRPQTRRTGHKPLRGPGLQVLLALLVEPALAARPVRTLAERAAASKSTAANVLQQLKVDGRIAITNGEVRLDNALWDTFATGYAASLRPTWLQGRFRAQERDLAALEARVARVLGDEHTWAWGGGAAADRMIGYYHGPTSVLHIGDVSGDLRRQLRLLRAEDGPVILIRTPCPAAFVGPAGHIAAPALVYAELVCAGDDRAIETAAMIRDRYGHGT